ncbi:MAG: homoserine O-acetyltransferase [Acidobacteriota bacterium]
MTRPPKFDGPPHGPSVYLHDGPFPLECGASLPRLEIAYETWGDSARANEGAVLLVHALTGDAHAASGGSSGDERPGWWEGLVGRGRAVDPSRCFVLSANLPGSGYGSTGPSSQDPGTGRPYGPGFPVLTTRDMARALSALVTHLGLGRLRCAAGGSLGAMVIWELAVEFPGLLQTAVPIAGDAAAGAWMVAYDHLGREAVRLAARRGDASAGLDLARRIAMVSYRTPDLFDSRFGRRRRGHAGEEPVSPDPPFEVETYLAHQGRKLVGRFDADAYLSLLRAMDLHDIGRGRGGLDAALARVKAEVILVGITEDLLVPAADLRRTAGRLKAAGGLVRCEEIRSPFGHDAFLAEPEAVGAILSQHVFGEAP